MPFLRLHGCRKLLTVASKRYIIHFCTIISETFCTRFNGLFISNINCACLMELKLSLSLSVTWWKKGSLLISFCQHICKSQRNKPELLWRALVVWNILEWMKHASWPGIQPGVEWDQRLTTNVMDHAVLCCSPFISLMIQFGVFNFQNSSCCAKTALSTAYVPSVDYHM